MKHDFLVVWDRGWWLVFGAYINTLAQHDLSLVDGDTCHLIHTVSSVIITLYVYVIYKLYIYICIYTSYSLQMLVCHPYRFASSTLAMGHGVPSLPTLAGAATDQPSLHQKFAWPQDFPRCRAAGSCGSCGCKTCRFLLVEKWLVDEPLPEYWQLYYIYIYISYYILYIIYHIFYNKWS